jgi:hypothetical protein
MKKKAVLLISILIASLIVYSQIDLKEKAQLLGIQLDEKQGATEEEKLTDISFIFIDQPSAYYHHRKENLLTIEFYDAVLGEEELPAIDQPPFTSCKILQDKVDVNKDIEGLAPDLKDVVRIELTIEEGIEMDLTLTDDFNVISLSTVWTKGGKIVTKKTTKKSRWWMWVVGGVVGATGGVVGYLMTRPTDEDDGGQDSTIWNPLPPTLPDIPQ